jgi:hypothetical protein
LLNKANAVPIIGCGKKRSALAGFQEEGRLTVFDFETVILFSNKKQSEAAQAIVT